MRSIAEFPAYDVCCGFVQCDHLRRGKHLPSEGAEGHIVVRPFVAGYSEGVGQGNGVYDGRGIGCEA